LAIAGRLRGLADEIEALPSKGLQRCCLGLGTRSRGYCGKPTESSAPSRVSAGPEPPRHQHRARAGRLLAPLPPSLPVPLAPWASPGFVDTPNRTKSAIGVSHGEEAAAAIVLSGVQGGSGQGGAGEWQERQHGGA